MKKLFVIFTILAVLMSVSVFSEEFIINIENSQRTWLDTPYSISFSKLLDIVGDDFDANWYSVRVKDLSGNDLNYQIDDVDSNNKISAKDILSFTFKKSAKIIISDDLDLDLLSFNPNFDVKKDESEYIVNSKDFSVKISSKGIVSFLKYNNIEGNLYNELGTARIAGWSGSTYYVDKYLGKHVEFTSAEMTIKSLKVLEAGPICVTVVAELTNDLLPGLNQKITSQIFKTGDIKVTNNFYFTNYCDLMKLQMMATSPLTSLDDSSKHILPMFKRMVWAEQENSTPLEYWSNRNAIKMVDNKPYISFNAIDSMKPLWWGATYAFVSNENWRANFSEKHGLIASEILPEKPTLYSGLLDFISNNIWFYESREFRDGIFRWFPGEMDNYDATKGLVLPYSDENVGNQWMAKYKAGDKVDFTRIYSLYKSRTEEEAISFMEKRTEDIQSIKISN